MKANLIVLAEGAGRAKLATSNAHHGFGCACNINPNLLEHRQHHACDKRMETGRYVGTVYLGGDCVCGDLIDCFVRFVFPRYIAGANFAADCKFASQCWASGGCGSRG
jgi:hypothetical protein